MDKKSRQEWADSVLTGISGGCQCVRGHHTMGFPTEWGAVIRPGPGEAQAQQGHRAHHLRRVQAKPQRPLRQPEHQSHLLRALLHELRLSRTRPKESTQVRDQHVITSPSPTLAVPPVPSHTLTCLLVPPYGKPPAASSRATCQDAPADLLLSLPFRELLRWTSTLLQGLGHMLLGISSTLRHTLEGAERGQWQHRGRLHPY